MRDEPYYDDEIDDGAPPARWKSALGAVASVCVLAAVVTWSYRLGMRDAAEVPVIRAIEGVAKVRPEDPGGARFDHQGRAVYGAMAEAEPADPAGAVEPAPAPEPLAEEDLPAPEMAKAIARAERAAAALAAVPVEAAPLDAPPPTAEEAAAAAEEAALAAALAAPGESVFGEGAPEASLAEGAVNPADEIDRLVALVVGSDAAMTDAAPPGEASALAPALSPVAPPRPRARAAIRAPEIEEAQAMPASARPEPVTPATAAAAPAGVQLQLGAYLSDADARKMWEGFRARNGDLLAGRSVSVAPARVGEQTLFLLRADPFADAREAKRICDALRARSEDCFVVGAN